ncbi:hypothetical protein C8J56DRAFT_726051, partial [Mycena floridula]
MMSTAKKYGVEFIGFEPLLDTRRNMPLWHSYAKDPLKRQINNGEQQECLRTNHGATTIGVGSNIASRLTQPDHRPVHHCQCPDCRFDRDSGCDNPHACAKVAARKLAQTLPKWTDQREDEAE